MLKLIKELRNEIKYIKNYCMAQSKPIKPSESGALYENKVARYFNTTRVTAGSTGRSDVVLKDGTCIECKTREAFEGGQTKMILVDGKLIPRNVLFREFIDVPFGGRIPTFCYGLDFSDETWEKESHLFRDEFTETDKTNLVSEYYRLRGSSYISVEGIGLYHTGEDPLQLGVPLFEVNNIKVRTRVKTHRPRNRSVMVSFNWSGKLPASSIII
jgi:hypothetical protein